MATYISLLRFTHQGIEKIKESPSRLDSARKLYEGLGAKLREFYLVTGRYDAIVVVDAPDDATVAKIALALGSRGNVRTETMRAFPEQEYRTIVGALP
jgi:uncharacterized protein with GYD domain